MNKSTSKATHSEAIPKVTLVLDKELHRVYKTKESDNELQSKKYCEQKQIHTTTFKNIQPTPANIQNKVVLDFVDYIYQKYPIKNYQIDNIRSQSLQSQKMSKQNSNSSLAINVSNKRSISMQKQQSSKKQVIRLSDKKIKYTRVNLKQNYQKIRDSSYYMNKLQSNRKLEIKDSLRKSTEANQTTNENETKAHNRINSTIQSTANPKKKYSTFYQQSQMKVNKDNKYQTPQRLYTTNQNQPSKIIKLQANNYYSNDGSFIPYSEIFEQTKIESEINDNFKKYDRQLSELSEIVHLTSAKKDSFKQPSTHLFEQEQEQEKQQYQQNQQFYKKSILDYYPKYRYCFGCEEPILEQNIKSHERICEQFISMKKLDFKGIEQALLGKLSRLAEDIRKDSLQFGEVIFRQFSRIEGVKQIQVFEKHYNLIAQQTNKIYRYLKNINKYKWFTKLKLHYKGIFQQYDYIA